VSSPLATWTLGGKSRSAGTARAGLLGTVRGRSGGRARRDAGTGRTGEAALDFHPRLHLPMQSQIWLLFTPDLPSRRHRPEPALRPAEPPRRRVLHEPLLPAEPPRRRARPHGGSDRSLGNLLTHNGPLAPWQHLTKTRHEALLLARRIVSRGHADCRDLFHRWLQDTKVLTGRFSSPQIVGPRDVPQTGAQNYTAAQSWQTFKTDGSFPGWPCTYTCPNRQRGWVDSDTEKDKGPGAQAASAASGNGHEWRRSTARSERV